VCMCIVCLYDMSLGSVLLGYFYRFLSTCCNNYIN
jgi:hypothetical protein